MDSTDLISNVRSRSAPFLAILRHDVESLLGGWLVRLWLAASFLLTFVVLTTSFSTASNANLIGGIVLPFLVFPWFFIVMVLGIGPTSGSQTESLADGILCRPVTRYEYLAAVWCSRVCVVLGVYLLTSIPSVLIITAADRKVPDDGTTKYGICAAIGVVALVLTFQVSLAFLVGTVLRKPLLSIVLLLAFWYPVNGVLAFLQQEEFSPIYLSRMIPALLLEQRDESDEGETALASDAATLSKNENRDGGAATPSSPANENIGDEQAVPSGPAAWLLNPFGGAQEPEVAPPVEPPPTEAEAVATEEEDAEDSFFLGEDEEFSFLRVSTAYGFATVICLGSSMLVFCRRDV